MLVYFVFDHHIKYIQTKIIQCIWLCVCVVYVYIYRHYNIWSLYRQYIFVGIGLFPSLYIALKEVALHVFPRLKLRSYRYNTDRKQLLHRFDLPCVLDSSAVPTWDDRKSSLKHRVTLTVQQSQSKTTESCRCYSFFCNGKFPLLKIKFN